ncbi:MULTISPECIES: ABC transporter ATP-binding protein [Sulfitobacter]|uniref:High-affinity branched-chain amino acid transport ATP-binding protein LivF n=1 Tax=Sulfitobacter dubius TaxID=218673 RepID=A0ABY3ZQQ0_9RHOB|nr:MULTISPECIES: ABC transporter ATP-binding protein [Sulfitobacter]UOA16494.1 High-affinity branched-chain amino acid transport ATP-binding protein LivF [Sulfitobacter dubius]UOA33786.1 High-affinity branched-chain amino acid transport ATP-binding protein LivF [Sulfitobacter sp. DSM 110093]UOA34047.1 High-affinity branched-chain amino acid transport ATP-binding protein LivF [Sulfitobacter sp. DSM 110093]
MLRVEELHVNRGRTKVLQGINFAVEAGEIATLIGANGAGKTTTLMTLSGLLPISSGQARLQTSDGSYDVGATSPVDLVRAGIVHAPEGRQIFGRLSIEENLQLGAFLSNDKARVARAITDIYERFPILGERRAMPAGNLSGGEQMMLAIGRALVAEPKLLLLDEPSLGLAPQITEEIFDFLEELNREQGVTMLIVEQNAMLALELADRAFVLENGRIVLEGSGDELLNDPAVFEAYLGVG